MLAISCDFIGILFEESSYEVKENIGINQYALRVCINIFNLTFDRSVLISTISGTATGNTSYPP